LRKLTAPLPNATCVFFINQLRQRLRGYGNPGPPPAQRAQIYASVSTDIRKIGVVKNGEQVVWHQDPSQVVRTGAVPFGSAMFEDLYGSGHKRRGEVVESGSESRCESRRLLLVAGERIAQGRDKACQYHG